MLNFDWETFDYFMLQEDGQAILIETLFMLRYNPTSKLIEYQIILEHILFPLCISYLHRCIMKIVFSSTCNFIILLWPPTIFLRSKTIY